jgi:hypothetical protein
LITPAANVLPFPHQLSYPKTLDDRPARRYSEWYSISYGISLVGHPAMSIPIGLYPQGTPFGTATLRPRATGSDRFYSEREQEWLFIERTQTPATEVRHESQRRDAQGRRLVSPDTPFTELAKLMREYDIGAIPIGDNDQLIGVVTDRDIV